MDPFISLLDNVIYLYMICVIVWTVISALISFKIINRYQPFVQRVMLTLDRLCKPALAPIQKYMPDLGGVDISPVILLLLLNFLRGALHSYF